MFAAAQWLAIPALLSKYGHLKPSEVTDEVVADTLRTLGLPNDPKMVSQIGPVLRSKDLDSMADMIKDPAAIASVMSLVKTRLTPPAPSKIRLPL